MAVVEVGDESNFDEKIKKYFPEGEFDQLPDILQSRHRTMYRNYLEMLELGLEPLLPDFMNDKLHRSKTRKEKNGIRKSRKKNEGTLEKGNIRDRPKRNVSIKNYKEQDVPELDDFVFCDNCEKEYEGACPKCGVMIHLKDNPVPFGTPDRAKLTVPKNFLEVRSSSIHGLGVFATRKLPKGIKMGPYEGLFSRRKNKEGYSWMMKDGRCVDGKDPSKSNWMRYVNCARHQQEQNVVAFQFKGQMYYRTVRDIEVGEEMLVFYGSEFASNLGIDVVNYFKPKEENIVEGIFPCCYCPLAYAFKNMMERHVFLCRSNPARSNPRFEGIFPCRTCEATFSSNDVLEKHTKFCVARSHSAQKDGIRNNEGAKKYCCAYCSYSTVRKSHLVNHLRTHTKEKPFSCDKCGSKFTRKDNLYLHIKSKHSNQKDFKCSKCKYSSAQKGNLKSHELIHGGTKPFLCSHCNQGFIHLSKLKIHLFKHTNAEKPYKCEYCTCSTATSSDMKRHIKRIHTKEKVYRCSECDYETVENGNLKKHMYIHLKLKPFKCQACDYAARQASDLKRHLNVHRTNRTV